MTNKERLALYQAWRRVFLDGVSPTDDAALVLRDLEAECYQTRTTAVVANDGHIDPLQMAMNEGRRQVYATIKHRLFSDLNPMIERIARDG